MFFPLWWICEMNDDRLIGVKWIQKLYFKKFAEGYIGRKLDQKTFDFFFNGCVCSRLDNDYASFAEFLKQFLRR